MIPGPERICGWPWSTEAMTAHQEKHAFQRRPRRPTPLPFRIGPHHNEFNRGHCHNPRADTPHTAIAGTSQRRAHGERR
jgi:hypothetical protein